MRSFVIHGNNTVSKVRYFTDHSSFVRLLVKQRPRDEPTVARYTAASEFTGDGKDEPEEEGATSVIQWWADGVLSCLRAVTFCVPAQFADGASQSNP